jgi:hypothetical protein
MQPSLTSETSADLYESVGGAGPLKGGRGALAVTSVTSVNLEPRLRASLPCQEVQNIRSILVGPLGHTCPLLLLLHPGFGWRPQSPT